MGWPTLPATAASVELTPADHRTINAFRQVLLEQGFRHTLATDHAFSPEVLELFTAGADQAAFAVWREATGIIAADLRDDRMRRIQQSNMVEALDWISSASAAFSLAG